MNDKSQLVIVCGSGLAGLSAAITCMESGAQVKIIEKSPEIGGTTVISAGMIWTFSDYEKIRQDIPNGDPLLQWSVYDNAADGRKWLTAQGVTMSPEQRFGNYGWGQIMDPPQAVEALARRFEELGGSLNLETGLHSLVTDNGAVTGVRVLKDGRLSVIDCNAVVLATGGFQGNPELLTRYVVPDPSNLVLRANPWSTGDGLTAAVELGAAVTSGLHAFYGHALTASPARYDHLEFRDATQYYGQVCVALNLSGERFADESEGTGEEVLNQQLARQPSGRGFYVLDAALIENFPIEGLEVDTRAIIDRAASFGAPIATSNTLKGLCDEMEKLGLRSGDRALKTLTDFNSAVESGRAAALLPSRMRWPRPLNTPPFIAVGVQAAITFTMGGLCIDENARVLWRSASTSSLAPTPSSRAFVQAETDQTSIGVDYRQAPIRGLYAAGCDVGNICHVGYMGGLTSALVTGRSAGRHAAAYVRH